MRAGNVEERKMMGGLVFMVNDKMCVGVDIDKKTQQDRLMVRVGKLPYEELLGKEGSREMDFTGKVMRGFLQTGHLSFQEKSRPLKMGRKDKICGSIPFIPRCKNLSSRCSSKWLLTTM